MWTEGALMDLATLEERVGKRITTLEPTCQP